MEIHIIKQIFNNIGRVLVWVACRLNTSESFINSICIHYEKFSKNFIRYRLIPKYSTSFTDDRLNTKKSKKNYGIIIQGQLIKKNDFTLETIRIYKKIFPMATIIVSTWKGEDQVLINKLKSEGCDIIQNDKPTPMGLCHVNYQIVSTLSGLKRAKQLGLVYCLKNRSDLRINYTYSLEYLSSLLDIFPVSGKGIPQKGRIISLNGIPGQLFFPYWIQDYLYFGYTEDLMNLFEIKLDSRNMPNSGVHQLGEDGINNGKDFYKLISPEMYITLEYLRKYKEINQLTVRESWEIIKNYFLSVNFEDLNVVWDKYNRLSMNKFMGEYDGKTTYPKAYMLLSFQNFVNLYSKQFLYSEDIEDLSEDYKKFII